MRRHPRRAGSGRGVLFIEENGGGRGCGCADNSAKGAMVDNLAEYLDLIVEPTFASFGSNPRSARHAYLACVATFHAVDRAAHPKRAGNLRKVWRKQSLNFLLVDMLAHHFKHVRSHDERSGIGHAKGIPLASTVFGRKNSTPDAMDLDLHNLYFVIRDAISFVRGQVAAS